MPLLKVPVTLNDHILGSEGAALTLVEYGDYECPYCGEAHHIVKRILEHFSSQMRFIFRNFPLTTIHPHAESAAEAAEFAASHDRFWQMHELIYENQRNLSIPLLLTLGESLKLPLADLEYAMVHKVSAAKIHADTMSGARSGVNGTPTFFINGERYSGPYVDLERVVKEVLS